MYESMLSVHPGSLFGQFARLQRELDDAFGWSGLPSSIRSVAPGSFPAVNVGRTDHSVEVYLFAPGLDAAKIDITLERGVLRISGERASTLPQGEQQGQGRLQVYNRERAAGSFTRVISLPDDIDPGKVDARYRDGVLHVSVARQEAQQPKRIAIQ